MLKRQALGTLNHNGHVIAKSTANNNSAETLASKKVNNIETSTTVSSSFPTQSSIDLVNNENKPPQSENDVCARVLDELVQLKDELKSKKQQVEEDENEESDYEDEYDEEEEEEDEESEDEESEEDEDEDEDEEKDQEFRDQFQDISQLNSDKTDIMNVVMLDSSSSPMILDETIRFDSKVEFGDDEEEEEEEEEDLLERYEETDEETRKRMEAEAREDSLKNCLEYKDDILNYMRQQEKENRPKANYMRKQSDITANMRSILVDWLVEVSEEYRLHPETLYLAVTYTDRFLSQMSVLRGKLQLVGTASMYIAAKYEEITPPDVSEFVFITDDTYTKKQVLRMEHLLLKCLDFRMSTPTIQWFLTHYMRFIKLSTTLNAPANKELCQRIESLARYLCELTLIDGDTYLGYLPSQVAASAIYLSFYTLGRPWTKQIAEQLGYSYDLAELRTCICDLHKTMQEAPNHTHQAIQEKYKQPKYDYASLIDPPKTLPAHLYKTASGSSNSSQ